MDAENIVKLTAEAIQDLLDSQRVNSVSKEPNSQRREERWPFPGTVEVWLPESCYGELHILATMHNLSPHGLAMRARRPLGVGTKISLALHQPRLTCYGEGMVRHCTQAHVGYLVGVEFIFPSDAPAEPED